jgi:hypothetical protein
MADELSGFYYGMDFETYQAVPAINGSSLLHMRRSPMKYRHELDHPSPPSQAMTLGTATHRLILGPDRVGDFAVWGDIPEHRTAGGAMRPRNGGDWNAFKDDHAGQMIVTRDERDAMVGMGIGARKSGMPKRASEGPKSLEHVGSSASGNGKK